MFSFLDKLFKPQACYRQYYVMEKFKPDGCECKVACKFPPPKELSPVVVPRKSQNVSK